MSEAKKKMTEEEILKSLDAIIDETMGKDEEVVSEKPASTETVAKSEESKDENKQANGGEDKIKSGAPMSEEQKAEAAKKAKAKKEKEDDEDEDDEKSEKSAQSEADLKKAVSKEEAKKIADKEADKEVDEHEKEMHKNKKMKKSIEELAAAGVDAEELELIKAWREENDESEEQETSVDIAKSVAQAVGAQLEDIKKSFEQKLSEKDDMIKSLSVEVKKLSTQPAHGRQSVDSLETIEKSGSSEVTISKSQVLDTMLELQKAGKGINSQHIAEFEATKNLSNPQVKALVMEETKKRFSN